jgi:hypothetical protein
MLISSMPPDITVLIQASPSAKPGAIAALTWVLSNLGTANHPVTEKEQL